MIDGEQFLTAFAHQSLGGEEVFRSGFIAHLRVGTDVPKRVKRVCVSAGEPAYESATFSRRNFTGMSDHGLEMFAPQLNCRHVGFF